MSQLPEFKQTPGDVVLPEKVALLGNEPRPLPRPGFVAEGLILAACAVHNLVAPAALPSAGLDSMWLIGLILGIAWSELAVLCAVLVFGEQRFWPRFFAVWAIGYGLALAFVIGIAMSDHYAPIGEIASVLACGLPLGALAAQSPLWAARIYLGWRVARPGHLQPPRPLSIGDIFGGTAIVAATVGAAKVVPIITESPAADYWIGWAFAGGLIALAGTIGVLPAMYLTFRRERAADGCIVLVIYAFVAGLVMLAIISAVSGSGPPSEVIVVLLVLLETFALCLWACGRLLRARGYRLILPGEC